MAGRFFNRSIPLLMRQFYSCLISSPSSRFASLVLTVLCSMCTRQVIKMPQSSRMNNEEPDVAHYYRTVVVDYSNVCLVDWLPVHSGPKK